MNSSVTRSGFGILLENSMSCVVCNSVIVDSFYGIGLQETSSSQVWENMVSNCTRSAISLSQTTACGITNNKMTCGGIEFARFEYEPKRYFEHEIEANQVGGRPILYLCENNSRTVDCSDYSQVIIVDSEDITLTGGDFKNVSTAVLLAFSHGCTVIGSTISFSDSGGWIHESDDCSVKKTLAAFGGVVIVATSSESFTASGNQFSACSQGFSLLKGPDSLISGNHLDLVPSYLRASGIWAYYSIGLTILNNSMHLDRNRTTNLLSLQKPAIKPTQTGGGSNQIGPFILKLTPVPYYRSGVATHGMDQVFIRHNNVSGFSYGVYMASCNSCIIAENTFQEIVQSCVTLSPSCTSNIIYGNSFAAERTPLAVDYGIGNIWYNSTTGGNYWSNYGGWGPYLVGGNASSIDWYPNGQNAFLHVFISTVAVVGLFIIVFGRDLIGSITPW